MERLNLNLLRALAVLLEQRNVTGAAKILHLTQSAISRQLAQLREYFGDQLLVREGNDYLLTAMAQQLKPRLQDLLNQIDNLRQQEAFDPSLCQRRFTFACTDYVANFIFPDILSSLNQQPNQMDLIYKTWQSDWLDSLGSKPIDFVATMINQVPDNLYGIHLGRDEPALLLHKDHPLLQKSDLSLEQLLAYPFVSITIGGDKDSFFDIELNRLHKQRRIAFEVPFYTSAFKVIASTDMLLVAPKHIALKASEIYDLTHVSLPMDNIPEHNYYVLWHSIHQHDSAHRWLREIIADQICRSIYSPRGIT